MSLLTDLGHAFPPPHPAGRPFILGGLAIAAAGLFTGPWVLGMGVALTLFCVFFFRDPARVPPARAGAIVSPADGRVVIVTSGVPPAGLGLGENPRWRVSIFLSVLNVHVNRVPARGTEQYPKGLGHTVDSLQADIGNAPVFEKLAFSCWRDDAMKQYLIGHHEAGRPQVIVAGIESHVCVLQTAIDLAQAGFAVFAVADAMASRAASSVTLAHDRMRQEGVAVINTEMALFELLGRAGTAEFKALSALIR